MPCKTVRIVGQQLGDLLTGNIMDQGNPLRIDDIPVGFVIGNDGGGNAFVPLPGFAPPALGELTDVDVQSAGSDDLLQLKGNGDWGPVTLNRVAFSGDYNDLQSLPSLVSTFTGLSDTPTILGSAGQLVSVNPGGTGLTFIDPPQLITSFAELTDTPSALGSAGQLVSVNPGGTELTFIDPPQLITSFAELTDTPPNLGQPGQLVSVNPGATGLVFTDPPQLITSFAELTDTPSNLGQPDQLVSVNPGGTELTFIDPPQLITSFAELTDTPSALGSAGQLVSVNPGATGLVFTDPPQLITSFVELTDTPSALGSAGQLVSVNPAGTGLSFIDPPSGGGGLWSDAADYIFYNTDGSVQINKSFDLSDRPAKMFIDPGTFVDGISLGASTSNYASLVLENSFSFLRGTSSYAGPWPLLNNAAVIADDLMDAKGVAFTKNGQYGVRIYDWGLVLPEVTDAQAIGRSDKGSVYFNTTDKNIKLHGPIHVRGGHNVNQLIAAYFQSSVTGGADIELIDSFGSYASIMYRSGSMQSTVAEPGSLRLQNFGAAYLKESSPGTNQGWSRIQTASTISGTGGISVFSDSSGLTYVDGSGITSGDSKWKDGANITFKDSITTKQENTQVLIGRNFNALPLFAIPANLHVTATISEDDKVGVAIQGVAFMSENRDRYTQSMIFNRDNNITNAPGTVDNCFVFGGTIAPHSNNLNTCFIFGKADLRGSGDYGRNIIIGDGDFRNNRSGQIFICPDSDVKPTAYQQANIGSNTMRTMILHAVGGLRIPKGNTAQRASASERQEGMIRFNDETKTFEGYIDGVGWVTFSTT